MTDPALNTLVSILKARQDLDFAVLVGSRVTGKESLAWARFLQRNWRELEDFYWDKSHAA